MKKIEIEIAAMSGGRLSGQDVVSRRGNVLKFRHVWPENVDARTWDGVKKAAMRLAQSIANKTGKQVQLYAKEGWMVEAVEPDEGRRS